MPRCCSSTTWSSLASTSCTSCLSLATRCSWWPRLCQSLYLWRASFCVHSFMWLCCTSLVDNYFPQTSLVLLVPKKLTAWLQSDGSFNVAMRKNAFLSPSHVDHICLVTNPSFLIQFGDAIPFQWKNLTLYPRHCGICVFDACKKHGLPVWPRFSIFPCVRGTTMRKCLTRTSVSSKSVPVIPTIRLPLPWCTPKPTIACSTPHCMCHSAIMQQLFLQ